MPSSFSSRGESTKERTLSPHLYSNLFNAFFFLFSRRGLVFLRGESTKEKEHCLHTCYSTSYSTIKQGTSQNLFLLSLLEERVSFSSRRIDERERTLSPHVLFKSLQRLLLSLLEKNQRKREHCLHTCYSNLFNAFFFLFSKRGLVEVEVEEETNRGGKKS